MPSLVPRIQGQARMSGQDEGLDDDDDLFMLKWIAQDNELENTGTVKDRAQSSQQKEEEEEKDMKLLYNKSSLLRERVAVLDLHLKD